MPVNSARIKALHIRPERIRELIKEIEKQEENVIKCVKNVKN